MRSDDADRPLPKSDREILAQLLKLAGPMVIAGLVQTVYHVINALWVGRLGADAVAVVSICFPINLLLISLWGGLSLAGSILIAQNIGANHRSEVDKVAAQTLTCLAGFSVLLTLIGYWLAPQIVSLLGAEAAIYEDTLSYLRITFASSLVLILSSAAMAILRGMGESKAPLPIIMASVVINAVLDPLLIYGWGPITGLEVQGAAYATLITQLITAVAGLQLMLQPRFGLRIRFSDLRPDWVMIGRIFRLGVPASVEHSMQAVVLSVMTVLVTGFGTVAIAAFGIVFRLYSLCIIPAFSISMAVSVLVGQGLGAGNTALVMRLSRLSALFNFAMMAIVGSICFVFAEDTMRLFVPGNIQVVESGSFVLRVYMLSMPLIAILLALRGSFRGAGDTFNTMLLTLAGIWLNQIPLAFLLSRAEFWGEYGLWYSQLVGAAINAFVAVVYFRSRRWLDKGPIVQAGNSA